MTLLLSIIYSLFICLTILVILLTLANKNTKSSNSTKNIEKVVQLSSSLSFKNLEGEHSDLTISYKYILLDLECKECKKIFTAFDLLNEKYFESIRLLIVTSDANAEKIADSYYKKYSYFIDQNQLSMLGIQGFPLYLKFNTNPNIATKGLINTNNMIELAS